MLSGILMDLFDTAEREVVILTYRFLPDQFLEDALHDLLRRGIRLTILLGIVRSQEQGVLTRLSSSGALIYVFPEEKGVLHAKLIMVDFTTAVVGSFNFTLRGTTRNHEIAVVVREPKVLSKLRRAIENLLLESSRWEP